MITTTAQYRQMYYIAKCMKRTGLVHYAALMIHRATGWEMSLCSNQVARL